VFSYFRGFVIAFGFGRTALLSSSVRGADSDFVDVRERGHLAIRLKVQYRAPPSWFCVLIRSKVVAEPGT
jgi:hypothetical protein